nr:MAG TPA: hypothetical protein [Caudoviricetes sp.]
MCGNHLRITTTALRVSLRIWGKNLNDHLNTGALAHPPVPTLA